MEKQQAFREVVIKRVARNNPYLGKEFSMWQILIPILRQVFLVLGTYLATKGIIEQGQVEALVGILIVATGALWRWIEMWFAGRRAK